MFQVEKLNKIMIYSPLAKLSGFAAVIVVKQENSKTIILGPCNKL